MNVLFDQEQLLRLVSNLYTLTGIRANILNAQGYDICLSSDHTPFCARINASAEGHARCVACDVRAVKICAGKNPPGFLQPNRNLPGTPYAYRNTPSFYHYRCHAGICEAILPIRTEEGQDPLAYLIYGQFLDESPMEEQWENCKKTLDWWPGNKEELRQAFFRFRRYSEAELNAYSEILEALSSYIRQKEMILAAERTDLQRLRIFLDQHYTEKLSLASISSQLHIGRTKLCQLARELSGGRTLSWLITQKRIDMAKTLLLQGNQPICEVAEAVGIGDYNYFTKLFRSFVGMTPSAFRKEHRKQ